MRVAIFDFDGTLFGKETFPLLMETMKNHPQYKKSYYSFMISFAPRYIAYKLKLFPEGRMKEKAMQKYIEAYRDISKEEFQELMQIVVQKMRDGFHQKVIDRLIEHRNEGYYTMLVSGAFLPLLEALPQRNLFDQMIGTKIPIQKGYIDQTKDIYHIQGERKIKAIHEALVNQTIDWKNSYAYGDSYSDLPVLQCVGNPVAVSPDERLHKIALEENWEIL